MILGIIAGHAANPQLEKQNPCFRTFQVPLHAVWGFDSKQSKPIIEHATCQIAELEP